MDNNDEDDIETQTVMSRLSYDGRNLLKFADICFKMSLSIIFSLAPSLREVIEGHRKLTSIRKV